MAKDYNSDQLATRIFIITMIAAALYIGASFVFVLLK